MRQSSRGGVFLHVYLAIFAALLVIFILGLVGVSLVNDMRAQQYRENLASAPMALLAFMVREQPEDDRDQWLREYEASLGMGLALSDSETLMLDYWDRRRLRRQHVLASRVEGESGWRLYRSMKGSDQVLVAHFSGLSEQQPQQLMSLLRSWLEEVPTEQRENRFKQLRDASALPMGMGSGTPVGLSVAQGEQLNAGNVVISIAPDRPFISLFAQLSDGRWITAGPIHPFEPIPTATIAILMIGMLLVLAGTIYLIVGRVEVRVKRLEKAASRLAAGHLDTRVNVNSNDYLGQLGHAFNDMASQVQVVLSAQQDLMRAVSHEFRTPVARIRFAIQMVDDMSESPSIKRQIAEIDADIEALDNLIDEILTYARLDSAGDGRVPLTISDVDSEAVVKRVIDTLQPLHAELTLVNNCFEAPLVAADERYLQRALQNLVGNACAHGRERIEVSLEQKDGRVQFHVDDDGPGVPERDRKRIFKPFARLDDSRARRSGGYGLGLAIVSKIVFWHQGDVYVGDAPTLSGARFTIEIPTYTGDLPDMSSTRPRKS
ncbi:ATP-binding protein [Larsenimonas rhizosphaerae]|uniref:histidine kinase n=1 Tax=Larsenimonas rhizosphaerae TaxID=2944682 RepID=A0AA41ZFT4_9GAMM|nr:ATP-binding protein [Larsenimonas rhizosphaerae]MCM2129847.1 ATP-binding protein [Larsenimonas rhizosphaerae]MCX2524507.1 ATP-binding protein [Larsenimonas rhizosphaerae]